MTRYFLEMVGGADQHRRVPIDPALSSPQAGKNGDRTHVYSLVRMLKVGDRRPSSAEVWLFLMKTRELCPQHFGMMALGFATGLRPSSLRPLRKGGATPDVLWKDGVLLVRRSQTVGEEVMNTTKTGRKQRLALPEELMEILRWHVDTLPEGPMTDSELLFPDEQGGFRSLVVLQKPFALVSKALGLRKHISPRAMRRTFQDLARTAEVKDIVTRSISGHATEDMQQHYSTVAPDEMRSGLAKVISLGGFREAYASGSATHRDDGTSLSGGHPRDTKKAS